MSARGAWRRFLLQRYEPLKAELEAFAQAVLDDEPVPVSGQDGLQALRLALALVESSKTHQLVEI